MLAVLKIRRYRMEEQMSPEAARKLPPSQFRSLSRFVLFFWLYAPTLLYSAGGTRSASGGPSSHRTPRLEAISVDLVLLAIFFSKPLPVGQLCFFGFFHCPLFSPFRLIAFFLLFFVFFVFARSPKPLVLRCEHSQSGKARFRHFFSP